jgi:hypothetical protein
MKSYVVFFSLVGSVVLGTALLAAHVKPEADETVELKKLIASLRADVNELKQRVRELESWNDQPLIIPGDGAPGGSAAPHWQSVRPSLPNGWVPFDFNGRTFYVIPLERPRP